jgi:hypothetical protein
MAKPKGTNEKKEKGMAQKAASAAQLAHKQQQRLEAQEAEDWNKGANVKQLNKAEEAARKADLAAAKQREKAELLAQEEASLTVKKKKVAQKQKNPLDALEASLIQSADKKVKQKKEQALTRANVGNAPKQDAVPLDPLLANTQAMIGSIDDDTVVGRDANRARMQADEAASGIDAALDSLTVSSSSNGQQQPIKSAKALYAEFEASMLPRVKDDHPGLRLTQYKEKVWALWKKSAENPANQMPR